MQLQEHMSLANTLFSQHLLHGEGDGSCNGSVQNFLIKYLSHLIEWLIPVCVRSPYTL